MPQILLIFILTIIPKFCLATDDMCFDCGKGGWEVMKVSCSNEISSSKEFLNCLKTFKWAPKKIKVKQIKKAFISIGSIEINDKKGTKNSFKVYIYQRWACDRKGQLYLLGELG